jgi:hypothetical protein
VYVPSLTTLYVRVDTDRNQPSGAYTLLVDLKNGSTPLAPTQLRLSVPVNIIYQEILSLEGSLW